MDYDDVLAPNALYEMAKKLNEGIDYDYIYSDEDNIDYDGTNRHMPHFKCDWAPDYDLTLRFMKKIDKIGYIPKILYHWRETKTSIASSITTKLYILEAAKKAKEDVLKRRGVQ